MSSTSNTRRRKPRVVYSKDEVSYLQSYFSLCPNPDKNHRVVIAEHLNKTTNEIATWFKNQRTYVKIKASKEKPTTPIQIPPAIDVWNQENFLFPVNQPSNSINSYQQVFPTGNDVKKDFVVAKRARKARFTFTKQLKEALEKIFKDCPCPDHWRKNTIAEELNIDSEVVAYWFKNRRSKAKKKVGKENSAPPPQPQPSPPQQQQPITILEPHTYYRYQLLDPPSLEAPMAVQLQYPESTPISPPPDSSSNFSDVLNEIYQSIMYEKN